MTIDRKSDKRDLVTIADLGRDDFRSLMISADAMARGEHAGCLSGKIVATLFFEPSTRTRLSFEAAAHRLGAQVISVPDAASSSAEKGESLRDTIRVVAGYADAIVLRHGAPGAAAVAAEVVDVPIINAGDGGHEHPTQTLTDLYALRKARGGWQGLRVVVWGDLLHGRTVHSLLPTLIRLRADVLAVAHPGLELPDGASRAARRHGVDAIDVHLNGIPGGERRGRLFARDPALWHVRDDRLDLADVRIDALYLTRTQHERFDDVPGAGASPPLPTLDLDFAAAGWLRDAVFLHPLPRREELASEVDADSRARYFEQAHDGVPVRMALLANLLGERRAMNNGHRRVRGRLAPASWRCGDPACISSREHEHVATRVAPTDDVESDGMCFYCDHRLVDE